ncbi:MAG TPA: DUF2235 domain-containing protein [Bradyrhizobium sp.]|nr:DUF2235 domain-containing protein [Bradyrhizobium sp.]
MAKNIVLLSDGTGNSSASVFKTNVWRLFQILDLSDPQRQIAFYDDGVGTSSFKLFAILGGIFGFGLKRNVIAIYSFCCRNYEPGDRIYCFGFSRGAFTIRIVAGLIASQGLVRYDDKEADLARFAADAYRAYRRRFDSGIPKYLKKWFHVDLRGIRDLVIRTWRSLRGQEVRASDPIDVDSIHFVGIWDTVDAYGGPIQEMTRAIDYWIWPLSMPDHFMSAKVLRACHALSLEDERDAFSPVIWDERYVRAKATVAGSAKANWLFDVDHDPRSTAARTAEPLPQARAGLPPIDRQRISQVWFTGVHADIGGGYPQNGLSFVALDWMMDRAQAYGLHYLDQQRQLLIDPQIDLTDKLNDSRKGLASYYRYKPRNLKSIYEAPPYKASFRDDARCILRLYQRRGDPDLEIRADLHPDVALLPTPTPIIHEAVFDRIDRGTDRYAPVVIPAPHSYKFTGKDGSVAAGPHPKDPQGRSSVQDDVWNWIWLRRVVYFLTVFATAFVAFIPFFVIYRPGFGLDAVGSLVNPLVNAAASFLPSFLEPWFVAFRNAPGFVLIGAAAVGLLLLIGTNLRDTIHDAARLAWHAPHDHKKLTGWRAAVHQLRRFGSYQAFFYALTHWIVPTAIMWWLFWWLAFGTANTFGLFCKPSGHAVDVTDNDVGGQKSAGYADVFLTRELCHPTGLKVSHLETYQIALRIDVPWADGNPRWQESTPTDPDGFKLGSWRQLGGIPFRRLVWSNWFRPIVRVGSTGFEEHVPNFVQDPGDAKLWTAKFTARSDGEVFIYVNDTSIFLPWLYRVFYDNNQGSAWISMKRL